MAQRTIVLGIAGGIAAYKTPELIRQLTATGFSVIPVLTEAGSRFVTATTLAAVSGETVRGSLWDADAERSMGHIELARAADALVVAPATTDVLAKFAMGIADDLLTTIYTATEAPTLIAPAMNQQMYQHRATQRNLKQLADDGVSVVGPNSGDQACGEVGPGRMSEPVEIAAAVEALFESDARIEQAAVGLNVMVTAGPTRERIDPVRFLTNSSSGRQGFAVAKAAEKMGANVTLVSGPVSLDTPDGVERIDVESTAEMQDAVHTQIAECDILFAVAAVADYKPKATNSEKIKKSASDSNQWSLELEETQDVVKSVANLPKKPLLVGFAAETNNVLDYAREKRIRKNLDIIVVNDVSDKSIGFDSAHNRMTLISADREIDIPFASKDDVAERIVLESLSLLKTNNQRLDLNGTNQ